MNKPMKRLLIVLTLFLATALAAQAQELGFKADYERIDSLRADLIELVDRAEALQMGVLPPVDLSKAKRQLAAASDEEMSEMYAAIGPYISEMRRVLDRREVHLREMVSLIQKTSTPPFPEAVYPEDLSGSGGADNSATWSGLFSFGNPSVGSATGGDSDFSITVQAICSAFDLSDPTNPVQIPVEDRLAYQLRFDNKFVILLAEVINDVAGHICGQEGYIAGIGGDFSAACIPFVIAFHVARPLEEFPAICDALINSAEIQGTYLRLEHLHEDLEQHETALATHDTDIQTQLDDGLEEIVDTLDATAAAILTSVDESRQYFTRSFIERALRGELGNGNSNSPNVMNRIASVYLPELNGGLLSEVDAVVDDAIMEIDMSGESTYSAASLLAQAQVAAAGGSYKDAWDLYSEAYVEAERCKKNDPACK